MKKFTKRSKALSLLKKNSTYLKSENTIFILHLKYNCLSEKKKNHENLFQIRNRWEFSRKYNANVKKSWNKESLPSGNFRTLEERSTCSKSSKNVFKRNKDDFAPVPIKQVYTLTTINVAPWRYQGLCSQWFSLAILKAARINISPLSLHSTYSL